MSDHPNPGSPEAVAQGCACPVLDNAHGAGWMGGRVDPDTGKTRFVLSLKCALHGMRAWTKETT